MSYSDSMLEAEEAGKFCESCDYFPVETKQYSKPLLNPEQKKETFRFCEFCARTMTSNAMMYPRQYNSEYVNTVRAMGWSHNRLMAEIRDRA